MPVIPTFHDLIPRRHVSVQLTPDAASYAYSYHRILSDLLLVEGPTSRLSS